MTQQSISNHNEPETVNGLTLSHTRPHTNSGRDCILIDPPPVRTMQCLHENDSVKREQLRTINKHFHWCNVGHKLLIFKGIRCSIISRFVTLNLLLRASGLRALCVPLGLTLVFTVPRRLCLWVEWKEYFTGPTTCVLWIADPLFRSYLNPPVRSFALVFKGKEKLFVYIHFEVTWGSSPSLARAAAQTKTLTMFVFG